MSQENREFVPVFVFMAFAVSMMFLVLVSNVIGCVASHNAPVYTDTHE